MRRFNPRVMQNNIAKNSIHDSRFLNFTFTRRSEHDRSPPQVVYLSVFGRRELNRRDRRERGDRLPELILGARIINTNSISVFFLRDLRVLRGSIILFHQTIRAENRKSSGTASGGHSSPVPARRGSNFGFRRRRYAIKTDGGTYPLLTFPSGEVLLFRSQGCASSPNP